MVKLIHAATFGCALLAAIASPANAASLQFSADFTNPAHDFTTYEFTTYKPAGYITGVSYSDGVGGALRFAYTRSGANPFGVRFQALNQSFVFNPAVSGTITSIDASIQHSGQLFADSVPLNLSTVTNRLRVLAKQGTDVYEALYDAPGLFGSYGTYSTASRSGLLASDFLRFDPANPNAVRTQTGLDFGGAPITFGFEEAPPGVVTGAGLPFGGQSISYTDIRSFGILVNFDRAVAVVPEPESWALLILGFGVTGVALRRRKPQLLAA